MSEERSPEQLVADIVEAAKGFIAFTDGSYLHSWLNCTGPLSSTKCECGWTQLAWAVRRLHKAAEDAELSAFIAEMQSAPIGNPDDLRQRLADLGWRKDR